MKKPKQLLLILLLMSTLTGLAQKNYTKESVTDALKQGFVTFVNDLRPAYARGDSYKDFKDKIYFGATNTQNYTLPPIPVEGETLLLKAYQSLSANYSGQQLYEKADYKAYGKAIVYINNYSKSNSKSVADSELALFGGNSNLLNANSMLRSGDECKWWQLWCHLDQIFGPSAGGQILQAIVQVILIILL